MHFSDILNIYLMESMDSYDLYGGIAVVDNSRIFLRIFVYRVSAVFWRSVSTVCVKLFTNSVDVMNKTCRINFTHDANVHLIHCTLYIIIWKRARACKY